MDELRRPDNFLNWESLQNAMGHVWTETNVHLKWPMPIGYAFYIVYIDPLDLADNQTQSVLDATVIAKHNEERSVSKSPKSFLKTKHNVPVFPDQSRRPDNWFAPW